MPKIDDLAGIGDITPIISCEYVCTYVYAYVCKSYQILTYPDDLEIESWCVYM